MANFDLSSIVEVGDTFTDNDPEQTVYAMRTIKQLSPEELAQLSSFEQMAGRINTKGVTDVEVLSGMLRELAFAVDTFMHIVIPDMQDTRIKAIELNHKLAFMQWWKAHQAEIAPPPNRQTRRAQTAKAGRSSTQKSPSRASSRSTASTPTS